jgi:hypothetical protein
MHVRAALLTASVAFVVLAAGLLAGGLVTTDGTGWFFASIGSSLVAAVALLGAGRLAPSVGPSVGLATPGTTGGDDWLRPGHDWGTGAAATPAAHLAPVVVSEPEREPVVESEVPFPIADYDDLTTDEVVGLLPQLYSDELDVVEARERQGAARPLILETLDALRQSGTDADRDLERP